MSTIKANTLLHSDGSTTTQPSIPALDKRMAKAWVTYNHQTPAILDSYNISSITDRGSAKGTLNFTTAMANTNYCVVGNSHDGSDENDNRIFMHSNSTTETTSAFDFYTGSVSDLSGSIIANEASHLSVIVFGS